MEKILLLQFSDKAESEKFSVLKTTTISEIKKRFQEYNVRLFVNKNTEVKVFTTRKYDSLNLESVWDHIDEGYMILTKRESQKEEKKYFTTKEKVKETIQKYGVAIIPNVLTEDEREEMKNGMWDYLETVSAQFDTPIKRDDKKSWREIYNLMPLHSMLIQHWGLGHAQFIWNLRQNEKCVEIFSSLWNVPKEELLVSFDGAAFHMPPEETNRGYYRGNKWYHTDQKLCDSAFKCVQSWVTAFDVNEGDATLTFLEGSNNYHEEFSRRLTQGLFRELKREEVNKDWYKLQENEINFFLKKGCKIKDIVCPAGSMVLWDSRTFHAGKEALKVRKVPNFRCVVYLCYTPRIRATETNLKKKKKAFEEKRMTSHWPEKSKLFAKKPRTYNKILPPISSIPDPVLNDLGLKLAGF